MESALDALDFAAVESAVISQFNNLETIDKSWVEQKFRNKLIHLLSCKAPLSKLLDLVNLLIMAADKDYCNKHSPVMQLQDIFDCSTTEQCEQMFEFVEDRIPVWKSSSYFDSCRVHLLRMCNDLLRRLSRSVNTVFCGRILIFLARCLPLTEKSGLNFTGQFNIDNLTRFETEEQASTEAQNDSSEIQAVKNGVASSNDIADMEEGEMNDDTAAIAANAHLVPIDFNLYRRFWQLQMYFSSPLNCFDKLSWKQFQHNTKEVLAAFASSKLDETQSNYLSSKRMKIDDSCLLNNSTKKSYDLEAEIEKELQKMQQSTSHSRSSLYFAKYLTGQKLLQLQMNDCNFRRCILLQFLILFQYLTAEVKFKDKKVHCLSDEQLKWINENEQKIYQLLEETYNDGRRFRQSVAHILRRDEFWSQWKNQGCEDFTQFADKEKMPLFKRKLRAKHSDSKIDLGRKFVPTLVGFLQDAIEQADPESKVEEQYRLTNDENYQWRMLRLASRQSNYFLRAKAQDTGGNKSQGTAQWLKTSEFIEFLVQKTTEDIKGAKSEKEEKSAENDVAETETQEEELMDDIDEQQSDPLVSDFQLEELSKLIGSDWTKLLKHITSTSEEQQLKQICIEEEEGQSQENCCLAVLRQWRDQSLRDARCLRLRKTLEDAEIFNEEIAAILTITPQMVA